MGDTLVQDRFPMPEPFLRAHQFGGELFKVGSTKVLEFASLEQIPHAFLRVEFWCVARQALQMEPLAFFGYENFLDHLCPMNGGTIPNDEEFARNFAQQQT